MGTVICIRLLDEANAYLDIFCRLQSYILSFPGKFLLLILSLMMLPVLEKIMSGIQHDEKLCRSRYK